MAAIADVSAIANYMPHGPTRSFVNPWRRHIELPQPPRDLRAV